MTESDGWFADADSSDTEQLATRIREGSLDTSTTNAQAWPSVAVSSGFVSDEAAYFELLHEVTMRAARTGAREHEQADDQQLIHAVRAMDDLDRVVNELAERVSEWAASRYDKTGTGIEYAREIAMRDSTSDPMDERAVALAGSVRDLAAESAALRESIERTMPTVAPNLSMLAGPVLAARLISLAGGLDTLAKKPSGTVQVLGAEDALFAHLRGQGSSPKHGVIYGHEYVSSTDREHRGSAARALAGKLSIAARVDHYAGDRRPNLQTELDERIEAIRARGEE